MEKADLYTTDIAYHRYFSETECRKCGLQSCKDLIELIMAGSSPVTCLSSSLGPKLQSLKATIKLAENLPETPKITLPRPVPAELIEINNPKDGDPILVTANNQFTQEVILTVLSTTVSPFFVVFTETQGDTLDMAVILGTFNAETVQDSICNTSLDKIAEYSPLIIPGKAEKFAQKIQNSCQRKVITGPVCIAELPLFLGTEWKQENS
ncbi:MAG: hypothetical protein HQK83_06660 [Fibrobacteria bacterium]|nr:hypothetical protein [Fibrobacteria bacterium]